MSISLTSKQLHEYKKRISSPEKSFVVFLERLFDEKFYLDKYKDVKQESIHPLVHWLEHGIFEERLISRNVIVRIDQSLIQTPRLTWDEFVWKGRQVIVRRSSHEVAEILAELPELKIHGETLLEDLLDAVDWEEYVLTNPDVSESQINPVVHWLRYGSAEGRKISKNVILANKIQDIPISATKWSSHRWNGKLIVIRNLDLEVANVMRQNATLNEDDVSLVRHILERFDHDFYIKTNEDVREALVDPIDHYFKDGIFENRPPNATMRVRFDGSSHTLGRSDGKFFSWMGRRAYVYELSDEIISLYNEVPNFTGEDEEFAWFIASNINREMYNERYRDIRSSGSNPLSHFLKHGMVEGRIVAPGLCIRKFSPNSLVDERSSIVLNWQGQSYVITRNEVPKTVVDQVLDQAINEPSVFAAGANAISNLRIFDGPDLLDRDGVDVGGLLNAFEGSSTIIVIIPFLLAGGAEKYTSDLVDVLQKEVASEVTVIVTEQSGHDQAWRKLSILNAIRRVNVVYWKDVCSSFNHVITLARLLNAIRPKIIITVNSRLGLEVVAAYGRGISQFADMYCAYFSLGVKGLGVPYGVMFPRFTSPFAASITDNSVMKRALEDRYGLISKREVALIPSRVKIISGRDFGKRLQRRKLRTKQRHGRLRWAWYSRIELFKGTSILAAIARMRPNDQFDIFGPGSSEAVALGLKSKNINLKGIISNVETFDFSSYDGFIFTSLFEGMPNTVLEMTQHAIPVISTDVGGLKDTFRETSVMFVPLVSETDEIALKFDEHLNFVSSIEDEQITKIVTEAYEDVARCHSPSAHRENVKRLFGYD